VFFPNAKELSYILSYAVFNLKSEGGPTVTKTSELINDGSDATSTYVETDELGVTAFSNDYNDLDNKPTIPSVITNHSELTFDDGTNPHGTTKDDVELGNVDNTSDANKPISNATQVALNLKLDKVSTTGVERVYIINADGSQGTKATSEIGGGGASNVKEILVDLYNLPTTGLIETIVATYDVADMVAQDGIIEVDLRHGKNISGTQEILIYFSDSNFTFGTKIRRSALLSSSNSSVGFRTMFYIKNNEISDNRSATTSSQDDTVLGSNAIRTVIIPNASTMHFMHIVLNSNVNNNIIYGTIKNVK